MSPDLVEWTERLDHRLVDAASGAHLVLYTLIAYGAAFGYGWWAGLFPCFLSPKLVMLRAEPRQAKLSA